MRADNNILLVLMGDVTIGHYSELIQVYGADMETIGKVSGIFSQGDQKLADPEHEAIIAGFLKNGGIDGLFEKVESKPQAPLTPGLKIQLTPGSPKSLLISALKEKGYEIVATGIEAAGEKIDAIARRPGTQEAVVAIAGPSSAAKLVEYLERPQTSVWIMDASGKLFVFSRGQRWEECMALHESMGSMRERIRKAAAGKEARAEALREKKAMEKAEEKPPKAQAPPAGPKIAQTPPVAFPEKREEMHAAPPAAAGGGNGDGDDDDGDGDDDEEGEGGDGVIVEECAKEDAGALGTPAQPKKRPAFFIGARKLPRILKEEEVAEMMRISKPVQRDAILLRCMYFLGMSNAEAQNLMVQDIDSVNNTVRVHEGKNRRDRTLPVPAELMNDLKEYLGMRSEGYVIRGRDKKANRISDRHIRRIVKGYAKEAGVANWDEIHPHTLRHSYATHMLNHGMSIEAVQALMGHERLETTAIYSYAHSQAVKEKIERALLDQSG